jgi:predicted metal-binding protein
METSFTDTEKYRFLTDRARETGAADARVIPAREIVVEDRVREKCRTGCFEYGKHLSCPPHAPEVGDFRKTLSEYRYALVVKFRSGAEFPEAIRYSLMQELIDPTAKKESKESAFAFITAFTAEGNRLHHIMLELEKTAFNAGFPFALTTVCGPGCRLCGTCNMEGGQCNRPTMKRHCPEGLGINLVKTTEAAGMPIRFPAPQYPERVAVLLID